MKRGKEMMEWMTGGDRNRRWCSRCSIDLAMEQRVNWMPISRFIRATLQPVTPLMIYLSVLSLSISLFLSPLYSFQCSLYSISLLYSPTHSLHFLHSFCLSRSLSLVQSNPVKLSFLFSHYNISAASLLVLLSH